MLPQLTPEMQKAIADQPQKAVYVIDGDTRQKYVLLPANAYERIQALLYDDSEPDPNEFLPLAHAAFAEDWDAPGMEAYDSMLSENDQK